MSRSRLIEIFYPQNNNKEQLDRILQILQTMPTRDELNAAIGTLTTAVGTLGTDIQTLIVAVNNLPKPGDPDFTPEIAAVTDATAALGQSKTAVDDEITTLGGGGTPAPTPGP